MNSEDLVAELARDLRGALAGAVQHAAARFRPNPGPQQQFMTTEAFEALFGGAAGGGKSAALLHDALRDVANPHYTGILFRRTFPELEKTLIESSRDAYPREVPGATYNEGKKLWTFPSGAKIYFGYLERDADVHQYQSAEFQFVGFDELTHFTQKQYVYMLSRARSPHRLRPRIRAATNPGGPGHEWVMRRWAPWLDPASLVRAAPGEVLRYANRESGEIWCDDGPLTRVFIPARVTDNPHLMDSDPGYLERLGALDPVTRAQLRDGNWLIRPAAGLYFKRSSFEVLEAAPAWVTGRVRYWDRAATEEQPGRNPDWTVGLRLSRTRDGFFVIEHVVRLRGAPGTVEQTIKAVTEQDGPSVMVGIEQDPGQAGKFEASYYVRELAGYNVRLFAASQNKITRAQPVSAQADGHGGFGRVRIVRGFWNDALLDELEAFPEGEHDDQVDALSGAFNALFRYAGASDSAARVVGHREFAGAAEGGLVVDITGKVQRQPLLRQRGTGGF